MRVVIVGCGKIGSFLARELRQAGRPVIAIDTSEERTRRVTEETGALGVVGDGTDLGLLRDVELRPDDFVVAATGIDEVNLVACQLARTVFGIDRVLARLNDPRNRPTFEALEIPVVSVTNLIVQVISQEVDVTDLERVALIGRGEISVVEIPLPAGHPVITPAAVELPESSIIVAVERPDGVIVPSGDTELRPGDRVLIVSLVHLEDEVRDALLNARPAPRRPPPNGEPAHAGD
ncbi:MAG: NAD-binding protein [Acidimicrobiia bacterium]